MDAAVSFPSYQIRCTYHPALNQGSHTNADGKDQGRDDATRSGNKNHDDRGSPKDSVLTPLKWWIRLRSFAGHETSASALAWSLYLMALYPDRQDRLAEEARILNEDFSSISRLRLSRAVFREALRLYPPVPMMVRETVKPETFRERVLKKGSTIVISPWHL